MRYHYYYQTKTNESVDDWLVAKDRNDAYAQLRRRGIKPYKLIGRNPLAWKRWTAIAVLSVAVAALLSVLLFRDGDSEAEKNEPVARHQIYGARSIIANGLVNDWTACNFSEGERVLSLYAQPGHRVVAPKRTPETVAAVDACLDAAIPFSDDELIEYRQVKEIVESIKSELREYKKQGGTTDGFLDRLQERQDKEVAYYIAAAQELDNAKASGTLSEVDLYALWAAKNAELRAIGLPMLKDPVTGE